MEQERLVKGIWIPIEIWKDKNLTWNEKILFLEIDSYTSMEQDCFFSNEYISELLGISETNANKTLSSLINKGYVVKTKFDGRRRYVKSALSYSTTLPCQERQPSLYINKQQYSNLIKQDNKEEKDTKVSQKKVDDIALFEDCWVAYRRKGIKKKALQYWNKLTDEEMELVPMHIKAYVASRDIKYQKDFERYLRDKVFNTVVYDGNSIIYDPQHVSTGKYTPQGRPIWFDNTTQTYWTSDPMYYGAVSDGYTDENRPDGATLILNNARGTIRWSKQMNKWERV